MCVYKCSLLENAKYWRIFGKARDVREVTGNF